MLAWSLFLEIRPLHLIAVIDTSPENLVRLLADLGKTLASPPAGEGLQQGLASLGRRLGAGKIVMSTWHEDHQALQVVAWWGFEDSDVALYNDWFRSVRGGAPGPDAYFTGVPVVIPDLPGDSCPPEYRQVRRWSDKYDIGALIAVPLAHSGKIHGSIVFFFDRPREFCPAEVDLLASVAGQLSVAVEVAAARDVAKDRERRLASQGALIERLIHHAPWVIAYFDRNLVFQWVNPAALRLSPVPGETFVGKSLRDVFPMVEWPNPRFEAALRDGRAVHVPANPLRTIHQGIERTTYWDMVLTPVPDDTGNIAGILLLSHDASERVERERRQQTRIERLEELDRLKRDFLNVASHELRTPLSSILGYAEFLEDELEGPLTEGQAAYVRHIQDSAARLRSIVDDILDFARMEAGTFQLSVRECDLRMVVEGSVASLQPQAALAGVDLSIRLPAKPVNLSCDPARVGQVVLNLVCNAIKFTKRGGGVKVTMKRQGKEAVVQVRDSGIGIAEDHMHRLFEKFFQVDPSNTRERGGAGLGLAICRSLVEAHGGRIWASSSLGSGSMFEFALPIA